MSFGRDQHYEILLRQNGQFADNATSSGTSKVIQTDSSAVNRLTFFTSNGQASLFINGQLVFSVPETTLTSGGIGYFSATGKSSSDLTCTYQNTTVWKW